MPIEYHYLDRGGVLVKASGVVAGSEVLNFKKEVYECAINNGLMAYILVDFTELEILDLAPSDLSKLVEEDKKIAEHLPELVIAVASDKDLLFGIGRMWESYLVQDPLKIAVLRNIDEARI